MNEENDIIKTSQDVEEEGKGGLYPYDPTQADIDIREAPHSIFLYCSQVLLGNTMFEKLCFAFSPKPHFSIRQSEAFWQYIPK